MTKKLQKKDKCFHSAFRFEGSAELKQNFTNGKQQQQQKAFYGPRGQKE